MKTFFKCENCGKETNISGAGIIALVCQSCGCNDIKFGNDVVVSPVNVKSPGDVLDSFNVKKDESFLGTHPLGFSWRLSFPPPTPVVPQELPKLKGRRGRASANSATEPTE